MKKVFGFILKALFVLRYLNFCPDFQSHVGKRFNEKTKTNFKIYEANNREANNSIHILPSISKSKDNQTMKFGQLKECDARNNFLQKLFRNETG